MTKRKLLSLTLTLALVLTTVFAGTESIFAEADTSAKTSAAMKAMSQVGNGGTINADNLNNLPDTVDSAYLTYSNSPATLNIVVPKAGMLELPMILVSNSYLTLYDETSSIVQGTSGSTYYSDSVYVQASTDAEDIKYAYFYVKKAGTYQLQIKTSYGNGQAAVMADYIGNTTAALTKNKVYYGTSPNGTTRYYKVTAPGNGYFTLEFTNAVSSYPSFEVKLTNSKKNNLLKGYETVSSSSDSDRNFKTYYGVKKGTYYIAIKSDQPMYGFKVKYTKVSEKSGSTKSKAVSLSKGTTKKGIINATQTESSGDWYKFTIKKKQKVLIDVTSKVSTGGNSYGGLKVEIYQAGRSYAEVNKYLTKSTPNASFDLVTNSGTTLAAGTYYIKIKRYNKGSGQYTIKWLK